jgi:hypothetical protein
MSPDGSVLAYSCGDAVAGGWSPLVDPLPSAGVSVTDYPGLTTVQALTNDPDYHDYVTSWDPTGTYVYFTREPAGDPAARALTSQLWRVKADGSELAEPVPGLVGWDNLWGGATFMKEGVYGTATYSLPDYTNVPVTVGVTGVQNLAGIQTKLAFKMYHDDIGGECCPIVETVDTCELGDFISHWSLATPVIDQNAGTVHALAYTLNPPAEMVRKWCLARARC